MNSDSVLLASDTSDEVKFNSVQENVFKETLNEVRRLYSSPSTFYKNSQSTSWLRRQTSALYVFNLFKLMSSPSFTLLIM